MLRARFWLLTDDVCARWTAADSAGRQDTRISGIHAGIGSEAGFAASGVGYRADRPDADPGYYHISRALRLQAGVVISGSHNPYEDNGIKFFGAGGSKPADKVEADRGMLDEPTGAFLRRHRQARRMEDAAARYIEFSARAFPSDKGSAWSEAGCRLRQWRDFTTLRAARFHELGADVVSIGTQPIGSISTLALALPTPRRCNRRWSSIRRDYGIAPGWRRRSPDHGGLRRHWLSTATG